MNRGGIESYMMNYYRHFDRHKIQVDFVVHNAGGYGYYDEEIKELGGKIYMLPQKSKHPFTYTNGLKKILQTSEYKIIHTHMDAMGAWVLKVAKECGIPVRIAHSHNTQHLTTNPIKLYFLEKARKSINLYATHRMACSEAAGKWLFGDAPFEIIRNAIDIDRFIYNSETRKKIREELNIKPREFVIGHVGRFDTQKNHRFLIDVFQKVHQQCPQTKLLLIGEGRLMNEMKTKVEQYGLDNCVLFMGSRNDVNLLYNVFDLFVLPSLFEGLPVVSAEAAVNGLESFLADTITNEASIGNRTSYLPLDKSVWANTLSNAIKTYKGRQAAQFDLHQSGYDITIEAEKLQNIYLDLWKNN